MKTNVRLLTAIALLASACTTGSMVTSSSYSDDVYFTPGDHPPVIASSPGGEQSAKRPTTISGLRQEEAGKIVDNYLSDKNSGNLKNDSYALNNEPAETDTTYESDDDDEARYLINNYNDPEDLSYSTRIRSFYNPYLYDPYWDFNYNAGWGLGWGLGFGGMYGGFYSGWNSPCGGWYDPWYSYGGWGGYYGGGYWGGSYWGGGYRAYGYGDHRDRYYGRQNATGRGGSNTIRSGVSGGSLLGSSSNGMISGRRSQIGTAVNSTKSATIVNNSGTVATGRQSSVSSVTGTTRQAGTRYTVNPNTTRSTQAITNLRRAQTSGINSQSAVRSSTSGNVQRYTPTYSRPRTNIQSSYNSGTTRQYARPQSSVSSGSSNVGRYSRAQGSSSTVSSSGSYQSGSSRSSYSAPSSGTTSSGRSSYSNSNSGGYSAPSRSSSSGGGSSISSGGGGGFSGGGGGGSGRRH